MVNIKGWLIEEVEYPDGYILYNQGTLPYGFANMIQVQSNQPSASLLETY